MVIHKWTHSEGIRRELLRESERERGRGEGVRLSIVYDLYYAKLTYNIFRLPILSIYYIIINYYNYYNYYYYY